MVRFSSQVILNTSKGKNLKGYFPGPVFWDVDPSVLDVEKDKIFIIERVLSRNMGDPQYFELLERLYPISDIVRCAKRSEQIRGNSSIRAVAERYGIRPDHMKNYNPSFG